jgi:hypothetical protein
LEFEVLGSLVLDHGARRIRVDEEPLLNVVLRARVERLSPLEIGNGERDMRQKLNCRIQQGGLSHQLGLCGGELEYQPPAERVTDPVCRRQSECRRRLGEIRDVSREGPRWLPAGAAVPAEIEGQDATRPPTLLCKLLVHTRISGEGRRAVHRADRPIRVRAAASVRPYSAE